MSERVTTPRPTDGELAILRVLWDRGECTVREVHDKLSASSAIGYTTVLKLMQIMTEKGLVERDESERAHVYRPALSEQKTQKQLLGDLLDRAFGGSATKLVLQALSTRRTSGKELAEIRSLLAKLEEEAR
ncbi:MAG TPA: BlaI/MecI/CopY family transcriptional regulator [Thermoanaerobaculia bacterium]|nr:BlaI/MecI/CopY family transcriptional regulator [Thermoanaerobaculia bacterium]